MEILRATIHLLHGQVDNSLTRVDRLFLDSDPRKGVGKKGDSGVDKEGREDVGLPREMVSWRCPNNTTENGRYFSLVEEGSHGPQGERRV